MEQIKPEQIQRLLNEGTPQPSELPNVRASYAASVMEQLNRYFAGNPARPVDEEFDLMVETWTITLQDLVPEYRLAECFVYVRQHRTSTFQIQVEEICAAWESMKAAERALRPVDHPVFAKDVCKQCNGTGTKLFKAFDKQLGREYTYGAPCDHQ